MYKYIYIHIYYISYIYIYIYTHNIYIEKLMTALIFLLHIPTSSINQWDPYSKIVLSGAHRGELE